MKKTISTLAMLASTSSFALVAPLQLDKNVTDGEPAIVPTERTACLSQYDDEFGNAYVGSCDETEWNQMTGVELKENGCAEGQAAMITYSVTIPMCPTFVQL